MNEPLETRIVVSEKMIFFRLGSFDKGGVPFYQENFQIEFSMARVFHRVLNAYLRFQESNYTIFEHNDYAALGDNLEKILFPNNPGERNDKMKMLKNRYRDIFIDKEEVRCRIYLEFTPDAGETAMLPWEYMRISLDVGDKPESIYPASHEKSRFDLIRSFPTNTDFKYPKPIKKINVILVTARCSGEQVIDMKNKLEDWCRKLKRDSSIQFHMLEQPRYILNEESKQYEFTDRLKEIVASLEGPYIVHYFGHAKTEQSQGYISFVGDGNNADWIPDDKFADLFDAKDFPKPHMVVLQACSSGRITGINTDVKNINITFNGLAVTLVQNNIPAVVAMQNDVTEVESFAFLDVFYSSLAKGDDVAEAVTKGRTFLAYNYKPSSVQGKIKDHSSSNFGTPVLFLSVLKPFAFTEKEKKPEINTSRQQYKYCLLCRSAFILQEDKTHENHKTIDTSEESYYAQLNEKKAGTDSSSSRESDPENASGKIDQAPSLRSTEISPTSVKRDQS